MLYYAILNGVVLLYAVVLHLNGIDLRIFKWRQLTKGPVAGIAQHMAFVDTLNAPPKLPDE